MPSNQVKTKRKADIWTYLSIILLCFFALFILYPLFKLFITGFQDTNGNFSLTNFKTFFTEPYYYNAFFNSMKVTLCSTLITMVLGTAFAYIMATVQIKAKSLIQFIMIIVMLSPPFISAYSWIMLLGNQGVITKLIKSIFGARTKINIYGFPGILTVFSLKLFPYVYMYVQGAMKKLDSTLLEASESMGYSGLRKAFTVVFPLILPTALAAFLVSFANAFADFGTPALIGRNYKVMATLVYDEYINEVQANSNLSAALGILMVAFTLILFALQKWVVSRKTYSSNVVAKPIVPKPAKGVGGVLAHVFIYLFSLLAMLPQLTVIYISFQKSQGTRIVGGFTFDNIIKAWEKARDSIFNSYRLSLGAMVLIIIIGMIIGYVSVRRKGPLANALDTMSMMPFIIPGSILGIMLIRAFNTPPILLTGTGFIIIIAFVMRRMMYTVRSSAAILYQISPQMEEASIILGYNPFRTFLNITGRLMLTGVLSGAVISWIACINELSSSVMLYNADTKTMSVFIYLEAFRGYLTDAAGMSAIMTMSMIIAVLAVMKLTGSKEIAL